VRALDRKLLRDLWRLRGQAFAIALVLAAACATFVMSMGVHRSLIEIRDAYYAHNRFADVFADMVRAPREVVDRVRAIPGVRQVQGTIRQYAVLDLPHRVEPVRALINEADSDDGGLNRITLRKGRLPLPGVAGEVVADEGFAEANGLAPGSLVPVIIHGRRQVLRIVGTGLAPDFIYAVAPGEILPDDTRFGVLWMGRRALEAATDRMGAINALSLTLRPHAREADVIRAVDRILAPYGGTGAYGRKDHLSHAFLENELTQLDALARVIPPVFLLVAVFLVSIVLDRTIRTERTQIGLLKAFGYSDRVVAAHYLKFALAIALLATVLGTAGGVWMGEATTGIYARYYRFPFLYYRISPLVVLGAGLLSFAAAAAGALGGMRAVIRLAPAVAMAPPPPPAYRAGVVERLGRLAGFSATGHMIARHIARWPARSAVTVVGVALAGGLLFATLQFIDSSRTMLDTWFLRAQRQDLTVSFTEARDEDALFALAQVPGVLAVEPASSVPVRIAHGSRSERAALEGILPDARLSQRIDADGRALALPVAGVILSRQLADKLAVHAGQSVEVRMLGGRQTVLVLEVTGVVNEYVGARAYAPLATLDSLARDHAITGAALLRIDPARRAAILTRLKGMPFVLGVSEKAATMRKFRQMIDDNMLTMIGFYVAFASSIAVGVVYNSARILFSERAHELATLRVLGYFRSEVGLVLVGELAVLVALSIPLSCLIGYGMARLMTAMFSSDLFRLPFAPSPASYAWSVVVVMLAATGAALAVARRVQTLDMVRVLKARE
jgi:putative ABC transport system permease protein